MPSFDTPDPISVTLEIGVGDVRIVASDRADTSVEVRPSDASRRSDVTAAELTGIEYADGRLHIKSPKGWKQYSFRSGRDSIDVQIDLPTGSDVRGDLGMGRFRTTGRLGECRFKTGVGDIQVDRTGPGRLATGAGDITVDQITGDAEISTGTGTLQIGSIDGSATVKNSNGDTWIGEVAGDLRMNASNGRIAVDQAHATVAAKTANGDVRIGEVERGAVVAQTAYLKVEVGVREGVAAWLDLDTHFGNVENSLDPTGRPSTTEDTVEVRARSSFGDITVHRSLASQTGKGPK
jgi:DUF4097 and DUF4098 domain-containing protein YvlB